jgi:hypothetical protein
MMKIVDLRSSCTVSFFLLVLFYMIKIKLIISAKGDWFFSS